MRSWFGLKTDSVVLPAEMCPQTPTSSIRKDATSATFSKLAKKDYDISRMCASNTITNCRGISIVPAFQATETTIPCCRDCRSGYSSTEAKHFKLKSMKTKHFFRDWELTRFLIILFILSSLCKEGKVLLKFPTTIK